MSHEDQKRRLRLLALMLAENKPLAIAERDYLARSLHAIGSGDDANQVFGTRLAKGQKISDVDAKRKLSFILHWVAGAISSSNNSPKITLEQALIEAEQVVVPIANRIFGNIDNFTYSVEYLKKCWHKYPHMQSLDRNTYDDDYPFNDL